MESIISFDEMNETDVREAIVRPLLVRLGYGFGQPHNIRTEVPLRYDRIFLGRKNENTDPILRGRADYICEVISYGRWVIEVKKPTESIDINASYQAYSYAAHPEIAAWYYVLTNGKEFQVYKIGHPEEPILTWAYYEIDERFIEIKNLLGPNAIRKFYLRDRVAKGKPLADGLSAEIKIVGGYSTYIETKCSNALIEQQLKPNLDGFRSPIVGVGVSRQDNGLIRAVIKYVSMNSAMDPLLEILRQTELQYDTADEFISRDRNKPSIFQNIISVNFPKGMEMPRLFGNPKVIMPIDLTYTSFTQAVGYYEDKKFRGVFNMSLKANILNFGSLSLQEKEFASLFQAIDLSSVGDFEVFFSE